jgi:IclR family pca regulon transcriptional regulator
MAEPGRMFVKSLAKGMQLLETFTAQRPRLTLTELSAITGMNKATVQRLTHTLMALDYLGRDRHKQYFLAPKVLALGYAFKGGSDLRQLAEPLLERFSRQMGCTVNLSVLDDTQVVILYRHEVERFFKFDLQAGSRLPAYCTSMGKLLLASLADDELAARLGRIKLEKLTANTITDPNVLWEHLMGVRAAGMAEGKREASLALHSRAVPILDREGKTLAAINASLPAQGERTAAKAVTKGLIELGRELSSLMGYEGPYPALRPPRSAPVSGKD